MFVCCLHGSCDVWKVHAHLFPQNVSQRGRALPDPLCEATVLQEHSCALFPVSIRSLVQIRDFLLCVCWRKARASIIPCLPHVAWDPVLFGGLLHSLCTRPLSYYHVMGWLSSLFVLSKSARIARQRSLLPPGLLWVFTVKQTFSRWHTWSSWNMLVKSSHTWPQQRCLTQLILLQSWDGRRFSLLSSNKWNGFWETLVGNC